MVVENVPLLVRVVPVSERLPTHRWTVESSHPFLSITCQIRHKQILRFCIVSIAQVASKATSTMASAVVAKMTSILAKEMFGVV